MILFPSPPLPATFLRRDNRFRAAVLLDGRPVAAHVPNSGRLRELFVPGAQCYVTPNPHPGKTSHVLRLVAYAGTLVSVDARLPGALFVDALERCRLGDLFEGFARLQREVVRGDSRLDFLLTDAAGRRLWVETKSVTLVEDGVARFPDAPTARGTRHLRELMAAVEAGDRAAAVFVVQRPDAVAFAPHTAADPAFGATLLAVSAAGVQVLAYRCQVTPEGAAISGEIPVRL